jgi:hypothetical protein
LEEKLTPARGQMLAEDFLFCIDSPNRRENHKNMATRMSCSQRNKESSACFN